MAIGRHLGKRAGPEGILSVSLEFVGSAEVTRASGADDGLVHATHPTVDRTIFWFRTGSGSGRTLSNRDSAMDRSLTTMPSGDGGATRPSVLCPECGQSSSAPPETTCSALTTTPPGWSSSAPGPIRLICGCSSALPRSVAARRGRMGAVYRGWQLSGRSRGVAITGV